MWWIIGIVVLVVFLIIISVSVASVKRPKPTVEEIGAEGEKQVKSVIEDYDGEQYVFNNYMAKRDSKTSQIDHIVINKYGVFVIETKNYAGTIFGRVDQQKWTQVLAGGNKRNKFYNPVKQNATHIYRICKNIPRNIEIHSLVVYVRDIIVRTDAKNVIPLSWLHGYIHSGAEVLTSEQMRSVRDSLANAEDILTDEKQHIAEIHKTQRDLEFDNICPRCGGRLVVRNGRNGEFYGCSNYPNCRFTKNIDKR